MSVRPTFVLATVLFVLFSVTLHAQTTSTQVLVPFGSTWKYLDDGSDQGTAWSNPSFSDSTWPSGPGELGYGDGDESTVLNFGPDPLNKYITYYFRSTFEVSSAGQISGMTLRLKQDDGG